MKEGFNIKGNSGCCVELVERPNGRYLVRKSTTNKAYIERLKIQAAKQVAFAQYNTCSFASTPAVLQQVSSADKFYFDMEYFKMYTYFYYMFRFNLFTIYNLKIIFYF